MRLLQGLADAGFSRQHQLRRWLKLPVRTTLLPGDLMPQGQHGLTLTAELPSSRHLECPSNDRHIAVELRVLAQKSIDLVREERKFVFKRQFLERNHLEPRAGYKSSPQEEHLAHLSSSDTPVVVMEPTEHGDCVDAAIRLEWTWNRLLVTEGLVRTRFVVVADVLGDDAPEVVLTEDEDMIEHLSAERADEVLSKGFMSGARIAVRTTRTPDDLNTPAKREPSFVS